MSRCIMSLYFHSPSDVRPDLHRIMCCSQYGQWLGDVAVGVIIINRKYKTLKYGHFYSIFYIGRYLYSFDPWIRDSIYILSGHMAHVDMLVTLTHVSPLRPAPGNWAWAPDAGRLLTPESPDMPAAHGHFPRPQPARGCVTSAGSTLCSTDRTGPLQCIVLGTQIICISGVSRRGPTCQEAASDDIW